MLVGYGMDAIALQLSGALLEQSVEMVFIVKHSALRPGSLRQNATKRRRVLLCELLAPGPGGTANPAVSYPKPLTALRTALLILKL